MAKPVPFLRLHHGQDRRCNVTRPLLRGMLSVVGSHGVIRADSGHCRVGARDTDEVNGQRRELSC